MAFIVNKKAFCVLEFAKTESIVTVQRRFRIMYHTEPPTDKTIREWYMNSSRVAACTLRNEQAVRAYGPPNCYRLFSFPCLLRISTQPKSNFKAFSSAKTDYSLSVPPCSRSLPGRTVKPQSPARACKHAHASRCYGRHSNTNRL